MKTYKNLYEKIISEENLKKAFYAAAKGKKNRRDVRQILNNIDEHVCILHEILKKRRIQTSAPHTARDQRRIQAEKAQDHKAVLQI